MVVLDRFMHSAVYYPADYGFVPQTLCEDGDAIDVLVICDEPLFPGVLTKVKILGVMNMIDDDEADDKLIGVYAKDHTKKWDDLSDVPEHMIKQIEEFFLTYKNLKGGKVSITGFKDKAAAFEILKDSQKMYAEKFK